MSPSELNELWRQIVADLQRARDKLPHEADCGSVLRQYHEFLDNTEFELACDMLEACADHSVSREFWLALKDAALKMQLYDHAARYASRAADGNECSTRPGP